MTPKTNDPVELSVIIDNLESAREEIEEEREAMVAYGTYTAYDATTFDIMLSELDECIEDAKSRLTLH